MIYQQPPLGKPLKKITRDNVSSAEVKKQTPFADMIYDSSQVQTEQYGCRRC